MPGTDMIILLKGSKDPQRIFQLSLVSAVQIRPSRRAFEQSVSGKDLILKDIDDAPRRMAGREEDS